MLSKKFPKHAELHAKWRRDTKLGLQVSCQVFTVKPGEIGKDHLPTKASGVVIGANPGAIKAKIGGVSVEVGHGNWQWYQTEEAEAHYHLPQQLRHLASRRSLTGLPSVEHLVIVNSFTMVNPRLGRALGEVAAIEEKKRIRYACRQLKILNELPDVRWVWCAWSQQLPYVIARAMMKEVEIFARAHPMTRIFWVEGKKRSPRVCHFKTGLTKEEETLKTVCYFSPDGSIVRCDPANDVVLKTVSPPENTRLPRRRS